MGHISFVGKLDAETLKGGAPAFAPGWTLDKMAKHSLDFWLISEDLPDPENRVTLDANGGIVLSYNPNNEEGHKRLIGKLKELMKQQSKCKVHGTIVTKACLPAIFMWGSGFRWPAWRIKSAPSASAPIRRPARWTPIAKRTTSTISMWLMAARHLRAHKIKHASTGPQTIPASNQAAAGIRAFYFKDPDGHHLEIVYFPQGKGDPRWQNANRKLFLGIDHTAIVVADTAQSLKFYRDLLGLKLAGESMNYGTEQEHLNNVAGARLRISGLRAQNGLGIEFLDYLAPKDGRPTPESTRANDLWHWQTVLSTTSLATAAQKIRSAGGRLVSPAPVAIPDKSLGFTKGLLARDPDGHGLQLIEK